MFDIHCHLLFQVDDGAKSLEESIAMLKESRAQGIDKIILTPHYRHGMFAYPKDRIEQNFSELNPYAEQIGVQIYLGTEYHVNSQIVQALSGGRCLTMAGTKYVLTEYAYHTEFSFIHQMTEELLRHGYIPIIAHVERYACMTENLSLAESLQEMGAWVQVNADAVLGLEGRKPKQYCRKLLKNGWVDVIASDSHGMKERACHMADCYAYISKKYDEDYAKELFCDNPAQIFE